MRDACLDENRICLARDLERDHTAAVQLLVPRSIPIHIPSFLSGLVSVVIEVEGDCFGEMGAISFGKVESWKNVTTERAK